MDPRPSLPPPKMAQEPL